MDIEPELPEDFDELPDSEKVQKLEELRQKFEEKNEDQVKVRMIEELKASYED